MCTWKWVYYGCGHQDANGEISCTRVGNKEEGYAVRFYHCLGRGQFLDLRYKNGEVQGMPDDCPYSHKKDFEESMETLSFVCLACEKWSQDNYVRPPGDATKPAIQFR